MKLYHVNTCLNVFLCFLIKLTVLYIHPCYKFGFAWMENGQLHLSYFYGRGRECVSTCVFCGPCLASVHVDAIQMTGRPSDDRDPMCRMLSWSAEPSGCCAACLDDPVHRCAARRPRQLGCFAAEAPGPFSTLETVLATEGHHTPSWDAAW
jgi:hypothetical protein